MYKQIMLIILLFSFIFLLLFPGCQPSTTPGLSTGTISGQAALPGSSSKDITGYTPIPGATVTVIDAQGNTHTTLTDSNGFYSFDNIPVKANTIINITKDTAGGGKIVFMEVIPQALSPEESFYAGIADAESTSLALVIEALINLGQLQEEINLEEIISAPGFAQLEEAIRQAQSNNQDILTLSSIITQAQAIADYMVNPPPAPTPSPTPVPSSAKEILTYGFEASNNAALSFDVTGTIDSINHTVSLTVPYGTDITTLIATFTLSAEATAKVGATSQATGTTPNDFTLPVIYTVTIEDNSTQNWIVTVSIAQPIHYVATTGNNTNDGSEALPWETIQYALDTIPSSGTILVKGGIYHESVSFPTGKVITLRSVNGTFPAIIIGDKGFAAVTSNNSLEGTTLEAFTITHNTGDNGRGIYANGPGFLTIKNCIIYNNGTDENGGGIYNSGTLTITGSTISDNDSGLGTGGIYNSGTLTITGTTISGNDGESNAGGIHNTSTGTLTITGSTISDNYSVYAFGGIENSGTLTITGTTISGNKADLYSSGGGIRNSGTLSITGSTISGNNGGYRGTGGIYNSGTLSITGSTISGNVGGYYTGGIHNISTGTLTITGSTISGNNGGVDTGGIYNSGTLAITGSTISGNVGGYAGAGGIYLHSETNVTIGGSSDTDTNDFNTFINNKKGTTISAEQHIQNSGGDCHANYPYNNFTPGP